MPFSKSYFRPYSVPASPQSRIGGVGADLILCTFPGDL
jgi:hypothetical protein